MKTIFISACLVGLIGVFFASCVPALEQRYYINQEDETPTCWEEDEYIPHHNCSMYYQCVNYVPLERVCAGGNLYWNPRENQCDYPFNVPECREGTRPPIGVPTTTEITPEPTTEPPKPTTEAPEPTTEAPEPTTEAPKPTTEAPEPTTEAPELTTTEAEEESTTVAPAICTDPDRIYYVPDPTDTTCTRYIACYLGFPTPLSCATGLLFDPNAQQCVRPEFYQCPSTMTTTTTTTTEAPISTTEVDLFPCPSTPQYIYMPHYASCQLFYLCVNGQFSTILDCGAEHWFDGVFQGCVPPQDSDCKLQPQP